MFIVCLLFDCCFLSFFFILFFFSNTIKRHKSRLNRRLNPGLKSIFSWLFSNIQQISQVLPSKSAFCSKVSFFLYVDLLIVFCLCFCESSVESLFSSCFYVVSFFWIGFYVQSFCGIVVFFLSLFFVFYLFPWFWSSVRIFFTTLCGVHWHIVWGFRYIL